MRIVLHDQRGGGTKEIESEETKFGEESGAGREVVPLWMRKKVGV